MRIDPRVHYVGMTALRTLSFDRLPQDELYVLQDRGQPVAVLVPYALFMDIQNALTASNATMQDVIDAFGVKPIAPPAASEGPKT